MANQVVRDSLYLLVRGMAGTILTMVILMGVTSLLRTIGAEPRNGPDSPE